jgi:hypothetical protein
MFSSCKCSRPATASLASSDRVLRGYSYGKPFLCSLNEQLFGFAKGQRPNRQLLLSPEVLTSHISDLEFRGVVFRRAISLNLHDSGNFVDVRAATQQNWPTTGRFLSAFKSSDW